VRAARFSPRFALPIDCVPGATCFVQNYVDHDPSSAWRDYACGARSYDGHDGTDFRVPSMAAVRTGVAVLAAADGVVAGHARRHAGCLDPREPAKRRSRTASAATAWCCAMPTAGKRSTAISRKAASRSGVARRCGPARASALVGLSGLTEFPHLHLTIRHQGQGDRPVRARHRSAGACSVRR
jgi:hypothetical protein